MRPPLLAGLGVLLAAASVAPAEKPAKWVELRSAHFHVVSNASPEKAQKVTGQLEEFRHLLGAMLPGLRLDPAVPTTVLLFKDKKSFLPYQPLTPRGEPANVDGFMQAGRQRMYLAVNLRGHDPMEIAFHEFIHLVVDLNYQHLPVWLNEGLAEFYERTQIRGAKFRLGDWHPGWWDLLRRADLIPLDVMLTVDRQSDYYNEEKKRELFYAQSWLLVHYLMVSDEGRQRPRFLRFVQLLRQAVPQETAFRRAFGTDFAGMQRELLDYLLRRRLMVFRGKMSKPAEVEPPEALPLSAAVAQAYLADLWLNAGRLAEAQQALQEMAGSGAAPPEVRERLGRIALAHNQAGEAEKHFQAALAERPDDTSLRYYTALALSTGRLATAAEAEQRYAAASQVIELLSPVVEETGRGFPDAYHLLVQARLAHDDPPADVIPLLERARQLMPQGHGFDILLADLYAREERWDDAEKVLQAVIARSFTDREREQAQMLLRRVRSARRFRVEEPDSPEPLSEVPDAAPPAPPAEPVETPPPALPPKVRYVEGILVKAECKDEDSALLIVKEDSQSKEAGKVLHLALRSRSRLIVLDPTGSGQQLRCGLLGLPVGINFVVVPQKPDPAGLVMTIEFFPRRR